jgi:hypothetical protein
MRVRVTVVVEVETNVWRTVEEIAGKVDTVCLGALERAGFDPVSCGYGYEESRVKTQSATDRAR